MCDWVHVLMCVHERHRSAVEGESKCVYACVRVIEIVERDAEICA